MRVRGSLYVLVLFLSDFSVLRIIVALEPSVRG